MFLYRYRLSFSLKLFKKIDRLERNSFSFKRDCYNDFECFSTFSSSMTLKTITHHLVMTAMHEEIMRDVQVIWPAKPMSVVISPTMINPQPNACILLSRLQPLLHGHAWWQEGKSQAKRQVQMWRLLMWESEHTVPVTGKSAFFNNLTTWVPLISIRLSAKLHIDSGRICRLPMFCCTRVRKAM